jgi:hypothetical protein
MLIIPLYYLLVLYAIFLIVFFTFFAINFSHIILTGTTTFGSFITTFIIIAASVLTLYGTWYYLQGIDWREPLFTLNFSSISNLFHSGDGQYFN